MARKHYGWKIGEPLPELGAHSLAKHQVFARYVDRYVRILSSHPAKRELNLTIVDGFCGGGRYQLGEQEIEGSPFVLLRSVRGTEAALSMDRQHGFTVRTDFHFVDRKKAHVEFLKAELHKTEFSNEIGDKIHLTAANFEQHCPSIIAAIKKKGPSNRALFFLDQYGWSDVSFAAIRQIFSELKNPEVIITFSVDSLIDYFQEKTTKHRSGRAIELTDEFSEQLISLKSEQGARYLIQSFLYKHIMEKTSANFYTPFFIKSVDNHRSYWLLHLSKHERARDEMARLHWDMNNTFVNPGGSGFNALGFDPNIDPNQINFQFDFGSNARADSVKAAMEQLPKLIRDDAPDQGTPVTIGELFKARCNETPLTMPLVAEAVVRLRDEFQEVEVLTADGKIRPSAKNLGWNDLVRTRNQRTFLRSLSPANSNLMKS
jgi:three-Cys-motif partner protein